MNLEEKYKFFNELSFFTLSNAAPALGKFLGDTITISTPRTELVNLENFNKMRENLVYTTVAFNDGDVGKTHVILTEDDALILAHYVIKQRFNSATQEKQWDEFSINAIEEVMNILGGNMTEVLTVIFGFGVGINVPELKFGKDGMDLESESNEEKLVLNTFTVHLGTEAKIKIKEVAKESYYKELVFQLKNRV